jgi:hypothetical protein
MELRERLVANGRRHAAEHYDWRELGDRFEAALEAIAGSAVRSREAR